MNESVKVTVFNQTGAVTQAGFGLALIFDPAKDVAYQEVTSTSEIVGFVSGDLAYKQAATLLSQTPRVEKVALYGKDVTASTIAAELDTLLTTESDWYWLVLASRVDQDITDTAAWVAAQERVGAAQMDITRTPAQIETYAQGLSNGRFWLNAHDGGVASADPNVAAGIVGRIAALQPGSWTAKFKRLNTVPKATYTTTELSTILGENVNTVAAELGVDIYKEGTMTDGSFIDIQIAIDWVSAKLREEVFSNFINTDKASYDDAGIGQVVEKVKSVEKAAQRAGIVAVNADGVFLSSVTYPNRADTLETDRTNRILKDVVLSISYSGAIHEAQIDFYLTA